MIKFTNIASLGVNLALLKILVVMRLEKALDKKLVKHNLATL